MASRLWYVVAGVVALAGIAGAVVMLLSGLEELEAGLSRTVVPGQMELALEQPGTYTIFHEADSVIGDKLYHADNISGLTVAVQAVDDGRAVILSQPGASQTYSIGGHSGVSIFSFEIDRPGAYRLSARYADGRAEPRTVLAVGHGFVGNLLRIIFTTLGLGLGGFGLGVGIAVVTLLKRRSLRTAGRA